MIKVEKKYRSSTHYVLSALVPYTEANLKFSFTSKTFFADLARLERLEENTVRNAYYRSVKKGLIVLDSTGVPRLTIKGQRKLAPYRAKKLKGAQLMVVFDIPEIDRWKRTQLRLTLAEFGFIQIQKSVWISDCDCIEYVRAEIDELNLHRNVRVYECVER